MSNESEQPLNEKQLAFCREYIIDFNQTQSAIRAGYSKRSAGAQANTLLKKANIQAEVKRLTQQRAERTGVTADRVVQQLAKIAFMDIKDVVDWGTEKRPMKGKNGRTLKDKDGKDRFYEVDYVRPQDPDGVDGTLIQSVKMGKYGFQIEIPDRMRAFEMLAKHTGVFDDRPQATVDVGEYVKALYKRTETGDIWDGFNNEGPGGEENGEG